MSQPDRPCARSSWLLPWLLLAAAVSSAAEPPRPVPPRDRPHWTPTAPSAPATVPKALQPPPTPTPAPPTVRRAVPRDASGGRRAVRPPAEDDRVLGYAHESGQWAARALFVAAGRLPVMRVGLRQGLRTAVQDRSLGDWDEAEGRHGGRLDDGARRWGEAMAADAAATEAAADADARVEQLFADLDRWPRPEAAPPAPPWSHTAAAPPRPTLEATFAAWPPDELPPELADAARLFDGWQRSPWWVCREADIDDILERVWTDPRRGFELWLGDRRRDDTWEHLASGEDRDAFRDSFENGFRQALRDDVADLVAAAWRDGFAAGWSYGAWVVAEWRFAVGYADGWQEAADAAAADAYPAAWQRAWGARFDATYREWQGSTVPRLQGVTARDGNDDGVFEPGETVLVEVETANLGGRASRAQVLLDGPVLEQPAVVTVDLAPRRTSRTSFEVRLRRDATPARRAVLQAHLGDQLRAQALWISHPLEIRGGLRAVAVDPVAGRAELAVTVVNASRLPVSGDVTVTVADAPALAGYADLGTLGPGAASERQFELDGIHGLDLLAGSVRATAAVRADGVEQARATATLPALATDLGSAELERYLAAMAVRPGVPAAEAGLARSLVLRRLRVDWEAAVAADGNPYRDDARGEGRTTALGDLVRLVERAAPGAASPQVFAGLRRDVHALSDQLPGTHPLLRRWFRRLADRLPR